MRSLLTTLFLVLGPVTAQACGNPLLWAMLFKQVPEAKVVFEAELAARTEGVITARDYDAEPGQSYHLWSRAWLMDLGNEMQPVMNDMLAPGEDLTILLADEVAVLRFSKEDVVQLVPVAGRHEFAGHDLITSINALKGIWRDGLSSHEGFSRNLLLTADKEVHRRWTEAF